MSSAGPSTTGRPSDTVAAIERELASIWSAPDPATGVAKVRATTLNYIAATPPSDLDALREMTDQIAETHAGRVLLTWVDGRLEPWSLWHEVSGVCRPSAGTSVCNDRVEIGFGAVAAERAASVMRSLVVPEVQVVGEVIASAPSLLVHAVVDVADRVVVDSRRMRLGPIADLCQRTRGSLADRAWVRTFSWRELVARFFDEAPLLVRSIRRVRVRRARPVVGGADPAHLLLGWLASRLGWSELGRGVARRPDGGAVEVLIEEEPASGIEAGELASIVIEAGDGDGAVRCEVARKADGDANTRRSVHWSRAGGGVSRDVAHDMALGHRDETWVLVKAIEATEGDVVYKQALLTGAKWETWSQ